MTGKPGDLREPVDDVGEVIEGVPEPRPVRRLGETEARQVGGDDMIVIRQGRDQVAEHVGRRRKSMKQEQRRRRVSPRFSVEDLETIHVDEAVPRLAQLVRQGKFHGYPPARANASLPTSGSRRRKSSPSPRASPRRGVPSGGPSAHSSYLV